MINEIKERMRLFPTIDKDGYKRLERLIDLHKGKLPSIPHGTLHILTFQGGKVNLRSV